MNIINYVAKMDIYGINNKSVLIMKKKKKKI